MISKREILASFLLNTYFVGCGDAGEGEQFEQLHDCFLSPNEKILEDLSAGEGMLFHMNGEEISQKEYFLRLADQMLIHLSQPTD